MSDSKIPEHIENSNITFESALEGLPRMLVPLYECGHIVLVTDREKAEQIIHSVGAWQDLRGHGGLAQYIQNDITGENIFLLGIFRDEVGIIAHESCHITFFIHEFIGEGISTSTANEPFCHLLDKIVEWAYENSQGAWDA